MIVCWPLSITHKFILVMLPNSAFTAIHVDKLNAKISRMPAAAIIHLSCCTPPVLMDCLTVNPITTNKSEQVISVMSTLKMLLTKDSVASIWATISGIMASVVAKQLMTATLFPR